MGCNLGLPRLELGPQKEERSAAWRGVSLLQAAGHEKEAAAMGKVIAAYEQICLIVAHEQRM